MKIKKPMHKSNNSKTNKFDYTKDLNYVHNYSPLWLRFYKKFPEYKNYPRWYLRKIMNQFWRYVSEKLVQSEHGIYLDNLGYFANTVYRRQKAFINKNDKLVTNFSNTDIYTVGFFSNAIAIHPLIGWSFAPARKIKQRIKEEVDEGKRYKNHIDLIVRNKRTYRWTVTKK